MNTYSCIIIDDEAFAIEGLKAYIDFIPNLKVIRSYTDPLNALAEIDSIAKVDLILLDIDMPLITGIELSKQIRQKTDKLVFTTAFTQYGYEAFEADADAYLLKPYSLSKFTATIAKLFPQAIKSISQRAVTDEFFFVKNKYEQLKIVKINFKEIVSVEGQQNYVLIHTLSKKVLTYMSLNEISKILMQFPNFMKFQRSFIICIDHIDSIDGNTIRMVNGQAMTVGDYYRKDFVNFLASKLLKMNSNAANRLLNRP